MCGSLSLGRFFGILLQIHWTFVLIIAWTVYVGWSQGGTIEAVLWTIALFVYFGASSEYRMIQQMSVLKGHIVKEAMKSEYTPLAEQLP